MIIDTSALLAILQDEPERPTFNEAIAMADSRRVSAATFVERAEEIAVGMRIAVHPPHRSQRARFGHWALTLDG
jgi:uncharacterized protein with PIN domain